MMLHLITMLLLAATCFLLTEGFFKQLPEKSVTCGKRHNVHRLSCESGVISVETALFGRVDSKLCTADKTPEQTSNTSCAQEGTLEVVKERCDGKTECEINIRFVRNPDPCPETWKYLETTHVCLPALHTVTCEGTMEYLKCSQGQTLFVYDALYGRGNPTTCTYQRWAGVVRNTNCLKHVNKVAESCNGRNECQFYVSNDLIGDPCVGTYKYMDVYYRCQSSVAICEDETLNMECDEGKVIGVYSASFGRSDIVTCSAGQVPEHINNTNCTNPTDVVADMCDGQQNCQVQATASVFGDPCPGTYKYLKVDYACVDE